MFETSWRHGDSVGAFVLQERVGAGAFAEVWRARDPRDDLDVAVKLLKPEYATDRDFRASLVREARALSRLNGRPHVVDAFGYDLDGPVYLVMQFAPGRNLSDLLRDHRGRGLGVQRSVAIVDQIAAGLEAAHAHNLVHLDVTPRNVRVGPDDEVYLVDFGLVGAIEDAMLAQAVIRGRGIGTARYMAPERLGRSLVAPDFVFDVYALGCVLYECLTGQGAFPQRRTWRVEWAARRRRRPRPSDLDPSLRAFDSLVADALAVHPDDRPGSIAAFRARLREVADR